jgi:hypothetical protein
VSARYEPRRLDDGGYGVWDNERGCRVEAPGMRDVYWFTSEGRAQAWVDREAAAALPGAGDWAPGAQVHPGLGGYEGPRV